ncbi:MAG: sugar ABC transporter ATP-binding protein [Spirochaetales bacterium]|nr:MAG: sugar ABC transporter ATP-binding protein [Spirochaetales bacterium]
MKQQADEYSCILEMKDIHKSFGGIKALNGVNLTLHCGEVLGLVGDNAAGKSTLMKILTGFYHADSGTIILDGQEVNIDSPKVSKKLGIEMVYQNLELCQNMNVAENLFLGREILRDPVFRFLKGRQMEMKSVEILKKLKIDINEPRKRVDRLSGGQQQAVAISKAVSFDPKMLILDEPTANLALKEIGKVLDIVEQLKEHGIPAIFISHRLDDVFNVCDRIFVLRRGRGVAFKKTSETDRDGIVRYMFLDGGNGEPQTA